jgi:hypothetical protein
VKDTAAGGIEHVLVDHDQAGEQGHAGAIDELSPGGGLELKSRSDVGDLAGREHDRLVLPRRSSRAVNDAHVDQNDLWRIHHDVLSHRR